DVGAGVTPLVDAHDPPGVDAVGRHGRKGLRPEVGSGEPEVAPALIAPYDDAIQAMRASERIAGSVDVSGLDPAPDVGRGDRAAAVGQQWHALGVESPPLPEFDERADVPGSLVTEAEVLAHHAC